MKEKLENTIPESALAQAGWGRAVAVEMWEKEKEELKRNFVERIVRSYSLVSHEK